MHKCSSYIIIFLSQCQLITGLLINDSLKNYFIFVHFAIFLTILFALECNKMCIERGHRESTTDHFRVWTIEEFIKSIRKG